MMSMRSVTGMAGVPHVVAGVACVATMRVSPAAVPAVRESTDCHGTKPNGASRQRDKVKIHGFKSMRWTAQG